MRIANSHVEMAAYSNRKESYAKSVNVKIAVGGEEFTVSGQDINPLNPKESILDAVPAYLVDNMSNPGRQWVEEQTAAAQERGDEEIHASLSHALAARMDEALKNSIREIETVKIMILQQMIERLAGRGLKLSFLDEDIVSNTDDPQLAAIFRRGNGGVTGSIDGKTANWGMRVSASESYTESQSMQFSAKGSIETADGRKIDLTVDLSMSRSFSKRSSLFLELGDYAGNARPPIDPLVIHFDAQNAGLANTKFRFDLDADGTVDQVSRLASGSGFLALDKNGDGVINDGKELFGPQSGDGFADLSAYDSDGNNWIDENDDVYDKLRIWSVDENGNSRLMALGQKGIGAIYLGNVETAFSYKNSANETQGELRRTGVFLREDGSAGTIQHIDMVI